MVAGNHSQITLEATYKVTQMLQRKKQARFILYCVVGGMKPELQHPLSSQSFFIFSHSIQTQNQQQTHHTFKLFIIFLCVLSMMIYHDIHLEDIM